MTNQQQYNEVRGAIVKAVPEIEGRNVSVQIQEPFSGIINYRNTDISLEDVLRVIKQKTLARRGVIMHELICKSSEFKPNVLWQLSSPLSEQSPETISFLHKLLVKN